MSVFCFVLVLMLAGLSGQVPAAGEEPLRSHCDPVLDKQPIRVVLAEPFLRSLREPEQNRVYDIGGL